MRPSLMFTFSLVFLLAACTSGKVNWSEPASSGSNANPVNISTGSDGNPSGSIALVPVSPGAVDPYFGAKSNGDFGATPIEAAQGISLFGFYSSDKVSVVSASAIDSQGRIVAAGMTGTSWNTYQFAISRIDLEGKLDTTFGTSGVLKFVAYPAMAEPKVRGVFVQNDGKIVVLLVDQQMRQAQLVRFNADASKVGLSRFDVTYGLHGRATLNANDSANFATINASMNPQDNSLLLVGTWYGATSTSAAFVSIQADATPSDVTLDNTFMERNNWAPTFYGAITDTQNNLVRFFGGMNPVFSTLEHATLNARPSTEVPLPEGGTLQNGFQFSDGSFLATGVTFGVHNLPFVAKYTSSNVLDTSFGSGGIRVLDKAAPMNLGILYYQPLIQSVVVDSEGNIFVLLWVKHGGDYATQLVKLDRTGKVDETFGQAGYVIVPTPPNAINSVPKGMFLRTPGFVDVVLSFRLTMNPSDAYATVDRSIVVRIATKAMMVAARKGQ